MNRPYVGLIAVGLLALAGGLSLSESTNTGLISALIRVGLVMGALWLAFPQLAKPVNWWIVIPILVGGYAFLRLPPTLKIGLVVASPLILAICWPLVRKVRSKWVR